MLRFNPSLFTQSAQLLALISSNKFSCTQGLLANPQPQPAERTTPIKPEEVSFTDFVPVKLAKKEQLSQWFYQFRFEFPNELKHRNMGCETGEHVLIRKDGLIRYYSPVNAAKEPGHVDLAVKFYPPREKPSRKASMLEKLSKMDVGDVIEVKGPTGGLKYKPNMVKKLGMIAGGSGIAPCLQILREIHQNRSIDKTEVTLLYGSPSLKEMVYMEEIEKIAHSDPLKSIKTHYFVGKLPENSKECPKGVSVGFITKEIMEKLLPKPTDNCLNLICGPPGLEKMCQNSFKELGYARKQRYFY